MKKIFSFFVFVFLLGSYSSLEAIPSYQTAFVAAYPAVSGTKLNSCSTCHMPIVSDFLNGYGLAVKERKTDFKSIEELDSDGDGKSNIVEINAGTLPGSHASEPEHFVFTNPKGSVSFNHEMHVVGEAYISKGRCDMCHSADGFPKVFNDNESVKDKAHVLCWKCHKDSGNPNAPKKCGDCHKP